MPTEIHLYWKWNSRLYLKSSRPMIMFNWSSWAKEAINRHQTAHATWAAQLQKHDSIKYQSIMDLIHDCAGVKLIARKLWFHGDFVSSAGTPFIPQSSFPTAIRVCELRVLSQGTYRLRDYIIQSYEYTPQPKVVRSFDWMLRAQILFQLN